VGVWENGRVGEWERGWVGESDVAEMLSFLQVIALRLPVWIPDLLFSLPRFRLGPMWIAQMVGFFIQKPRTLTIDDLFDHYVTNWTQNQ
jgi:hypothetical protein